MFDPTDISQRGPLQYPDDVGQGQAGWYGTSDGHLGRVLQQNSAYGQGYHDVDDGSGVPREPVGRERSSSSRQRQHHRKQKHAAKLEYEQSPIRDERQYSSIQNDGGCYERSAEMQNRAPSHSGLPLEEDACWQNGYSASTHSDPWSVPDTVRPRAGSFGNSSDEMRPHRRGGGKVRRDHTHYRLQEDDRLERSKDDALRGILSRLPKPSRRQRGTRDKHSKYPQQIDPDDLRDTNDNLPISELY